MPTVNMLEAKTKLSKLVEAVESGAEAEIILARNGKPVARIVPLATPTVDVSKRLGIAEGRFGDLSPETLAEWDREWGEWWQGELEQAAFPLSPPAMRRKA
jgi:prevent-host-death family protein